MRVSVCVSVCMCVHTARCIACCCVSWFARPRPNTFRRSISTAGGRGWLRCNARHCIAIRYTTSLRLCVCICMCVRVCICMCVCVCLPACDCVCVCIWDCDCVCMCVTARPLDADWSHVQMDAETVAPISSGVATPSRSPTTVPTQSPPAPSPPPAATGTLSMDMSQPFKTGPSIAAKRPVTGGIGAKKLGPTTSVVVSTRTHWVYVVSVRL